MASLKQKIQHCQFCQAMNEELKLFRWEQKILKFQFINLLQNSQTFLFWLKMTIVCLPIKEISEPCVTF